MSDDPMRAMLRVYQRKPIAGQVADLRNSHELWCARHRIALLRHKLTHRTADRSSSPVSETAGAVRT